MLEGKDLDKGYFISFKVICATAERAQELSFHMATELGLDIVNVEEVELVHLISPSSSERVEQSSGKSYFKL